MDLPFYREYELPWTTGQDQERKFQRLLGIIFLVCLLLSAVWPFIPVPAPDPFDVEEIPPRIAQLLLEEKPLPPPPPPPLLPSPPPAAPVAAAATAAAAYATAVTTATTTAGRDYGQHCKRCDRN